MDITNLLTLSRIPFGRIIALGGDLETIRTEAAAAGDSVLVARIERAIARR